MKTLCYSLTAFAALFLSACGFVREDVDLIVHNAQIWSSDPQVTRAEAFAVREGTIIEIGAERQILNKYRADQVYDAGKRFIYPGFIDAHCHFLGYGRNLAQADLTDTKSFEEVIERLKKHREKYPNGWLLGRGWDQNKWPDAAYPDRSKLDELFPDVPVYLIRVDGHAAIVNQAAFNIAGISTPMDTIGGAFILDGNRMTGVLIDNAMEFVRRAIPPSGREADTRALKEAERNCLAKGLTTLGDAGLLRREIELIDSLQQIKELKMQVYAMISAEAEELEHYLATGPFQTDRLNVRSFKFYADGALGSRGACLLEPYSDQMQTGHRGFLLAELDQLEELAFRLKEAGFQMNTHCIGDSANRAMLDIYSRALLEPNDLRWRIEHAQVVHKQDIPMFRAFTIIPSIQPTHATSDMYWAELRLGRNRLKRAYAYTELLAQNGLVALGTDFPVEGIDPLNTFYAAVVRKDHEGYPEGGFQPEHALSREQALMGMTLWAAIAQFEEERKGSLSIGKQADFVVLDRDLLNVSENELLKTRVASTFIKGEQVYENSDLK